MTKPMSKAMSIMETLSREGTPIVLCQFQLFLLQARDSKNVPLFSPQDIDEIVAELWPQYPLVGNIHKEIQDDGADE
jgi:hypothetical protein